MIEENKRLVIKFDTIKYFLLFLHFISITAYQLGEGFDKIYTYITFFLLIGGLAILSKKIIIIKCFKWNFLFWIFYYLSIFWAKNIKDVFGWQTLPIQILSMFIIIPMYIENREDIRKVLKTFLFALVYAAILLIIRTPLNVWGTERMGAKIGLHPNILGLMMSVGEILALYMLHNEKSYSESEYKKENILSKIIYICMIILFTILAIFSGSKKAIFMLAFTNIIFETFSSKGFKVVIKGIISILLIILLFYIIFNNPSIYKVLGSRIEKTIFTIKDANVAHSQRDMSLVKRTFMIEEAMKLFYQNPILGYGGNNFVTYMREINISAAPYSHNNYTELLSTLGIVGFCIYYYFWIYVLFGLIKKLKKDKDDSMALVLLIIIVCLLILDYGMVSYTDKTHALLLCIASIYARKNDLENNE